MTNDSNAISNDSNAFTIFKFVDVNGVLSEFNVCFIEIFIIVESLLLGDRAENSISQLLERTSYFLLVE